MDRPSPEAIAATICDAFDAFTARPPQARGGRAWADMVQALYDQLIAPEPRSGALGALRVLCEQTYYPYQNLAGELLTYGGPPCPRPLDDLLDEILPVFNASAEHTVRYLAASFGRDALLGTVRGRLKGADPEARQALRTFLYWLGEG